MTKNTNKSAKFTEMFVLANEQTLVVPKKLGKKYIR